MNCYLKHNTVPTKPCTSLKMYHISCYNCQLNSRIFLDYFFHEIPPLLKGLPVQLTLIKRCPFRANIFKQNFWKIIIIYLFINFIGLYAKCSQLTINHHWLSKWIRTTLSYLVDGSDKIYDTIVIYKGLSTRALALFFCHYITKQSNDTYN